MKILFGLSIVGIILGAAIFGSIYYFKDDEVIKPAAIEPAKLEANLGPKVASSTEIAEKNLKIFTPLDFKRAYDNLNHPNITTIIIPPSITGNDEADKAIRKIAEERGYRLRHIATGGLHYEGEIGMQFLMLASWQDLKAAASDVEIDMSIVSGYRSVEEQNKLFMERLELLGGRVEDIAIGEADQIVNQTLEITAPGGYSRHHSGYTIDIKDASSSIFRESASYDWLSNNNFENAKRYGFIPSYPEGLDNQGPRPEEWELVWVGKSVTFEQ